MAKFAALLKKLHFLFQQQRHGISCGGNDLSKLQSANFSEALGFLSLTFAEEWSSRTRKHHIEGMKIWRRSQRVILRKEKRENFVISEIDRRAGNLSRQRMHRT